MQQRLFLRLLPPRSLACISSHRWSAALSLLRKKYANHISSLLLYRAVDSRSFTSSSEASHRELCQEAMGVGALTSDTIRQPRIEKRTMRFRGFLRRTSRNSLYSGAPCQGSEVSQSCYACWQRCCEPEKCFAAN